MGWRDIGYNFLVDKCGKIYEGRAGGVANPVLGAHTLGFNSSTMGVAVLGTFDSTNPPAVAVTGVAQLTAWKLGLHGMDPSAKTYLTSGGGNLYAKGTKVRLNVISGHRDGFNTLCPGEALRQARHHPLRGGRLPGPLRGRTTGPRSFLPEAPPSKPLCDGLHTLAGRKTVRPVPAGSRDDR
ncbi:hypothetical protein SHIRM173S_08195 [Streptomyces hirsutus]